MTTTKLLNDLKNFVKEAVSNFDLPTAVQKGDTISKTRPPEVHLMRLPNSAAAKKIAPYILIQTISGIDLQKHGGQSSSVAVIRFVFCVYCDNEEEGALNLLNVMDAVRIKLIKTVAIGQQFLLNTDKGLERVIYTDDTAPYYAGEIIGEFELPPIEREVMSDDIIKQCKG